jgi:hypothetical protein
MGTRATVSYGSYKLDRYFQCWKGVGQKSNGDCWLLQLRQKETQDTAAGTRMLRRRPTNCRRKTDLRAISQPPYFFAPDYVSKFIRCRTDSSRDFAKVMGPRGDNIVIQCRRLSQGIDGPAFCSRGKKRLNPGCLLLHLRNEFANQVLAMHAHFIELDSLAIFPNPYHHSARVDAFARRRQSKDSCTTFPG